MKVKLFDYGYYKEKRVNKFLKKLKRNKCKIKYILQSGENNNVTISIWYEENDLIEKEKAIKDRKRELEYELESIEKELQEKIKQKQKELTELAKNGVSIVNDFDKEGGLSVVEEKGK